MAAVEGNLIIQIYNYELHVKERGGCLEAELLFLSHSLVPPQTSHRSLSYKLSVILVQVF